MSTGDNERRLSPEMRKRLITRAADRRVLLSIEPDPRSVADLASVRRLRALARLRSLVEGALASGASREEVLEAILVGDPELRPAAAAELFDGGRELLRKVRQRDGP
jgi:alkylhydroperoxidase/carboxymuconolactone decarboxylase family protein YurZ